MRGLFSCNVNRPTLIRIPFSHYCQKVEWAFAQAGIEYDCIDVPLQHMERLGKTTGTGLVPALVVDGKLLEGSGAILDWAAAHAAPNTAPLFPSELDMKVKAWQAWADKSIGPVARREAYRVAYNDPWHFTGNLGIRMVARAARPMILNILKFYKARRYEEEDAAAVPAIVARIAGSLGEGKAGYLTSEHATAADYAVAALARPLLYAAPGRNYDDIPGWGTVVEYIERVRPTQLTRQRSRRIRNRDWAMLHAAAQ